MVRKRRFKFRDEVNLTFKVTKLFRRMDSPGSVVEDATAKIAKTAKDIKETLEQPLTVLWEHLPSWQQDNHYILSGHRPASGSYRSSAASLGYMHNESVNIYSHLLGAILFAIGGIVLWTTLEPRYETASRKDVYVFGCFFLGAVVCLAMSATYHATCNHSREVATWGNKLDYLGIVFLICGSFIPSIYYGFTCRADLITTYWTMVRPNVQNEAKYWTSHQLM